MVVLEDIDSFIDAKITTLTMSGLLNCLDGLMRGDGLIVVLTANSIEKMGTDYQALMRTARIDIALEFTHANEFQTRSAFDHYFPLLGTKETADEAWTRLWAVAKPLQYSVAALQQFFFHARGKESLPVEEFEDITKGLVPGDKLAFYT
jgi:chaperone BCS1